MKRIIVFFMVLTMTVSFLPVSAVDTAVIPDFDVRFNGQLVDSEYRQFPLIVYKDITYVPMTYFDSRYLGLKTEWDNDTRTLFIDKGYTTCAYRDYNLPWKNGSIHEVNICDFNIVINGKKIDNAKEEYPLLVLRDVTYFPMTWRFAVEEFGWNYNFDIENGLSITSDNYHVETFKLPYITGDIATDGKYYYYSGEKDEKHFVFRVPVDNIETPEIIHELPDSPLTTGASFIESCGNIYITYFAGYSGVTGSRLFYKINDDGTVVSEAPDNNYSYGKHGSSELRVAKDGIKVKGIHKFFDGPTEFSYEIDGVTYEAEKLPGRVRVGRVRNGVSLQIEDHKCVQIFKDKIYYTARDLDSGNVDTSLYVIDTKTGENKKIIDGVCGFHVFNGWLAEEKSDSTMIIYDKDGYLMRYNELNGTVFEIEDKESGEEGLILDTATGDFTIWTVQKTADGRKTVVKRNTGYATNSSASGTILETKTGAETVKADDKMAFRIIGDVPEDEIRLLVVLDSTSFNFLALSDAVDSLFMYDNVLIYKIGKDTIGKVNLK